MARDYYYSLLGVAIQKKATEEYFPVVLFIMLHRVVVTLESVDEILTSLVCLLFPNF